MSKSLSVLILLSMDGYNSTDVYCEEDRHKQIYYGAPKMDKENLIRIQLSRIS